MQSNGCRPRSVRIRAATLLLLLLCTSTTARPGTARLHWMGGNSPGDLAHFPDERHPASLAITLHPDFPATGGSIGLAVWAPEGVAAARVLHDGHRPPSRPSVWTVDPPEDGRGGPPGYLHFALAEPAADTIRVPVRLVVSGPERPLKVELCWWSVIGTYGRADTLLAPEEQLPSVTVLGGPPDVRRSPLVHAIMPRVVRRGGSIQLLGAALDRIRNLGWLDGDGTDHSLIARGLPASSASRWFLPASIATGPGDLMVEGARLAHGALRVVTDRSENLVETVWIPADGDVLVLAPDVLYNSLPPLLQDLLSRGHRPAAARLSSICAFYATLTPAEAIRQAVTDACAGFPSHPLALILVGTASEDTPGNDLLPTPHTEYEHELPGYYDGTYAEDPAYGDLTTSPDLEGELLVGRIPVRTGAELSAYVAKLQAYRAQAASPRVLIAVGDAGINADNSDRRRAAESLLAGLAEEGSLAGEGLYASSYMPLSDPANRQRARYDLMQRLAGGIGVLDLFGNNTRPTNIVHMLEAPPGTQQPWILPEQMPTAGKLPIALFHTCLNGAFDEDLHFPGYDSPGETWVRSGVGGVVAAFVQSHLTTYFDDWELAEATFRRFSLGECTTLGALHQGVRWSLLQQTSRGERSLHSVRMHTLLGDPLIKPRLGVPEVALDGGFESGGAWPVQNQICRDRFWTTAGFDTSCASARVVYGGVHPEQCGSAAEGPVYPVRGARMLRIVGSHEPCVTRRAAAWTIFRCETVVRQGSLFTYWVRQEQDPKGEGRASCDAITASGRLLSRDLLDEGGDPADPASARYALHGWKHVTVRLDPWAGETIREVFLRYDDPTRKIDGELPYEDGRKGWDLAGEIAGGPFVAYLDEVRIAPGPSSFVQDGTFAADEDGDAHPDFWRAPFGIGLNHEPATGILVSDDGPPELWCDPSRADPAGASQLLGPTGGSGSIDLTFEGKSNHAGSLRMSLIDPLSGGIVDQVLVGPLDGTWREYAVTLATSGIDGLVLDLRTATGAVGIRTIRQREMEAAGSSRAVATRALRARLAPNPGDGRIRLLWDGRPPEGVWMEIMDTTGRRLDTFRPPATALPGGETVWTPHTATGRRLPAGIYFVRLHDPSGGSRTQTIQVIR